MKRLIIIAGVLILVANAFVFARAAYNRGGDPQTIMLTERELSLPYSYYGLREENSGIHLNIEWQTVPIEQTHSQYYSKQLVVSEETVTELGFDLEQECLQSAYYRNQKSRSAWVALEFDGELLQKHITMLQDQIEELRNKLASQQAAKYQLGSALELHQELEKNRTRLYVANVAGSRSELQQQYVERADIVILPAKVYYWNDCEDSHVVRIRRLLTRKVNVPNQYHAIIVKLPEENRKRALRTPRYQANIAIGKLAEPWLLDMALITRTHLKMSRAQLRRDKSERKSGVYRE